MSLLLSLVRVYPLILAAVLLFQVGDKTPPHPALHQSDDARGERRVHLIIWTDRANYSMRDTIKLNAALQNSGKRTTYVDRRIPWTGLGGGLKLEIWDEKGKPLPASLFTDVIMPPPKEGDTSILVRLEPEYLYGTYVYFDVKEYFPTPGRYTLRVSYGSWLHKEDVAPQLRYLPALWAGSPIIRSESVSIYVSSTAKNVPQRVLG